MKPSIESHILWLGPTVLIAVLLAATGCGLGGTTTTAEGFDAATTAETQALRAAESKAQPGRIVPTESVLPARAVFEPVVTQSEPQIDQQDGYQQAAAAIEDSRRALRRELAMRAFREAGHPEMSAPGERHAVLEDDGTVVLYMRGNKRKNLALQKHLAEQRAVHEELRRQEAEKQAVWRHEALLRGQERQAQFWAAEQERQHELRLKEIDLQKAVLTKPKIVPIPPPLPSSPTTTPSPAPITVHTQPAPYPDSSGLQTRQITEALKDIARTIDFHGAF